MLAFYFYRKFMKFWDWINDREETIIGIGFIIVVVIIPLLIYSVIIWDPIIGHNEDGDPIQLGMYIVMGICWIATYLAYKKHELENKLKYLLEKNEEERMQSKIKKPVVNKEKTISKSLYLEVEKKLRKKAKEAEEYKQFYLEVSPLVEKLNNNPELVKAILEGKIDLKSVRPSTESKKE